MRTGWLVAYVIIALCLNTVSTVMAQFYGQMPSWLKNNNILYNIHSMTRVFFFSFYIITVRPYKHISLLTGLLVAYIVFVIINFIFFEPILYLSPNLFAAESIVLLVMCMSYFFRSIDDESDTYWLKQPSFLVIGGICFYEVVTFFVFLFFNTINYSTEHKDRVFADALLMVYTVSYVILCVLLAIALYKNRKKIATTL
ncbi:MAG TPA: hypothetical protein VMZ03_11300 [Chitinophagaceae bacterium]|nr:hypothetical protein [Chitinophagaceae bacterium]